MKGRLFDAPVLQHVKETTMPHGSTASDTPRPRPAVGAIRWDAWTGGRVTDEVTRTLAPPAHRDRLPWFATIADDKTVTIDGSPQAVMDREIDLAADAGLAYWAFLRYPEESPMSVALGQYLRSQQRHRISFCLILHGTLRTSDEAWPQERQRLLDLIQSRGYMTVLGDRPLLYAFLDGEFPYERLRDLLAAVRAEGIEPYTVYMGWNPKADYAATSPQGFDAVSAYAKAGPQPLFTDLVRATEEDYWQVAADAAIPYIPLVTTGWDKRPRQDNPVSWEKGQAYHSQQTFPDRAAPEAIAAHLARALDFIDAHPRSCPARTAIVYAWNEYDEGGWLAPTRQLNGEMDNARLNAIKTILTTP